MDAETRHDLKTNELSALLERIRNFDDDRMRYALIVVAVALFLVAGYRWWQWSSRSALEADWRRLTQIEQNINTAKDAASLDAPLNEARALSTSGATDALRAYAHLTVVSALWQKVAFEPADMKQHLEQIRDELNQIVGKPSTPAGVELSATYALANACESLRDFAQAKQLYQKIKANPAAEGSGFKTLAEFRLVFIETDRPPVTFEPGNAPLAAPADGAATGEDSLIDPGDYSPDDGMGDSGGDE